MPIQEHVEREQRGDPKSLKGTVAMIILILGLVFIAVATALDSFFRFRMSRAGHKWALLKGGAFDYTDYHKVRRERGWASWPVYVMWITTVVGIALLIVGFFAYFGTSPKHG
jgi:amino acid transporter